ncbi:AraC family transcriptional regulator [Leptospira idonii]|uniref:AraC family transcriptional regulator n=1 Tax=Leptospira idonii TaxID=1193500 RepID=A0A4R9LYY8_9LEPT|nr:AraC family transcriptional regulator [Leptospira idonii]
MEQNLEGQFGLNQIAFFSNLSPWHFHRFFKKHQKENVQNYIKRLKIEKAAYELKISDFPILEIAMEAGYESNEAFTRAFKRYMGATPSQYRSKLKKTNKPKVNLKGLVFPEGIQQKEFRKKEIAPFEIVYVRHIGSYSDLPGPLSDSKEVKLLLTFINTISSLPENHKWVGISLDDPNISPEDKIRFDLGITVGNKIHSVPHLGKQTVTGGKYLQVRYRGSYTNLPSIYEFLMQDYIPAEKIHLRNSPPFEIYMNPLGKEKEEKITDIYLPIQK